MKFLVLICLFHALPADAAVFITDTWTVNSTIPDNDDVGYTDSRNLTIPSITALESVSVALTFSGGYNGDLYAYLVHGTGFSVLLNRPGRDTGTPDGAASSGMTIVLEDAATLDIHTAIAMSGGAVTGTFQPDGRTTDPLLVAAGDPRPALLSSFAGLDGSGTWTLFVADQSPGGTSTLQSWSLTLTGIPEPASATLLALSVAAGCLVRRRRTV